MWTKKKKFFRAYKKQNGWALVPRLRACYNWQPWQMPKIKRKGNCEQEHQLALTQQLKRVRSVLALALVQLVQLCKNCWFQEMRMCISLFFYVCIKHYLKQSVVLNSDACKLKYFISAIKFDVQLHKYWVTKILKQ